MTTNDQNKADPGKAGRAPGESVKDTLISIIIAFVLAFVYRGFVVEAFVIPTGSMAPTLLGAHMRFQGLDSGYNWPASVPHGPAGAAPRSRYGTADEPIVVHDPMTGREIRAAGAPTRSGDRILVLKFIYALFEPERFDVVVFKNPDQPSENYIKRLLGLPNEQIALIDGDVFTRPAGSPSPLDDASSWEQPGWQIARKPRIVQNAVWQPLFDSRYAPLPGVSMGSAFESPWVGGGSGWAVDGERVYGHDSAQPCELVWDSGREFYPPTSQSDGSRWGIDDRYPYNEPTFPPGDAGNMLVSDVRLRAGIEPGAPGLVVEAQVDARRHQFRARIEGDAATVAMRPEPTSSDPDPAWTTVGTARVRPLAAGRVTDVCFAHVDQALELTVGDRVVIRHEINWTPAQRIRFATGRNIADLLGLANSNRVHIFETLRGGEPRVRWRFRGAPLKLHRVGLDRDLHYRATNYRDRARANTPALATHPANTPTLGRDQFFVCGDNSPASADSRLWDAPDPWVAAQVDGATGVVPRKLLLGKAFFVYFPSIQRQGMLPVPDFGRMRFIW